MGSITDLKGVYDHLSDTAHMIEDMPQYENPELTVEEAAIILRVSPATVKRRCQTGTIAARKVGRSWLILSEALDPNLQTDPETRDRRSGPAATLDFDSALFNLMAWDLKRDVWVPDILRHADELAKPDDLKQDAAFRIDDVFAPFDNPITVAVPKSTFFNRNATDLSLVDRLAYQAAVQSFAEYIDRRLTDDCFSARLASPRSRKWLKNPSDSWLAWRDAVVVEAKDHDKWVIETDVVSFFDFVKHDVLFRDLSALDLDPRLIKSLREMLRTWSETPGSGLPQGPEASRVLANFYMLPIDEAMGEIREVRYFRYMDDIRIVGAARSEVLRALTALDRECRRRGLALSVKKTKLFDSKAAVDSLTNSTLDHVTYTMSAQGGDEEELRLLLIGVLEDAIGESELKAREARFAMYRGLRLREERLLPLVLDNLEKVAPLAPLVATFLFPWIDREIVQKRIAGYLLDAEQNVSPYLSSWLMAIVLETPSKVHPDLATYVKQVAFDRNGDSYHRAIAINVVAIADAGRNVRSLESLVRRETDPQVVRAALVALARVGALEKAVLDRASHVFGLNGTKDYVWNRNALPSLVMDGKFVRVTNSRKR